MKNSVRNITIPITSIFMEMSSNGYQNILVYHHGTDANSFVEQEAAVNSECLKPRYVHSPVLRSKTWSKFEL